MTQEKTAEEPTLLVALATYNEKGNLRPLIDGIRSTAPGAEVLVVDDNSPDGTGELADEMAGEDPSIRVLHRAGKQGLGTALLTAMRYAIDQDYDLLLIMDADFSHHPRYLPGLLAGMTRKDVMIGSRYVPGGGTTGWPISRKMISRGVNMLVRVLLRVPAKDASGAFRCYRVSMLREARLDLIKSRGYSFQQEVLFRCWMAGAKLGECPIVFENRREGVSKVNWYEAVRSLSMLARLGARSFFGFEKRTRRGRRPEPPAK